jgi:hypothetical protein
MCGVQHARDEECIQICRSHRGERTLGKTRQRSVNVKMDHTEIGWTIWSGFL